MSRFKSIFWHTVHMMECQKLTKQEACDALLTLLLVSVSEKDFKQILILLGPEYTQNWQLWLTKL